MSSSSAEDSRAVPMSAVMMTKQVVQHLAWSCTLLHGSLVQDLQPLAGVQQYKTVLPAVHPAAEHPKSQSLVLLLGSSLSQNPEMSAWWGLKGTSRESSLKII